MTHKTVFCTVLVVMFGCILASSLNKETISSIVPTNKVTTSSSSIVPTNKVMTSSSSIVPTNKVMTSSSSIVPTNKVMTSSSSIVPTNKVMTSSPSLVSTTKAISSSKSKSVSTHTTVKSANTIHSSFVVLTTASAASATQSLSSLSSPISVSTTSPLKSSYVSSAQAVTSPSPTVAPASETIRIPKSGTPCLQALLDVSFEVTYERKNKTGSEKPAKATVVLNGNLQKELDGFCNQTINNTAYFEITWNENASMPKHSFSMHFQNFTGNATTWAVTDIAAKFNTNDTYAFKDAVSGSISDHTNSTFGNIPHGQAYNCNNGKKITMGNVTVSFIKLSLQPFSSKKLSKKGKHCSADSKKTDDDDDNTVPIAVGAALGGLVLIVLVAYIVGRRRSNRGYEQV